MWISKELQWGGVNIYIGTANRFWISQIGKSYAKYFVPIDSIQKTIEEVTRYYSDYTVGVHIRRTDNVQSIENSPTELFISYMDKEIAEHPEVKFYIATDDEGVKEEMRQHYGDRIITRKWELSRKSVKGMQDAVAELYCLGRTNKILGSDHSTFSINASHLYDIPLVIVKKGM